jgi:hypothetical protein
MIDERREFRDYYLKVERTAEQRRKDLVTAFDEIAELRRDKANLWKLLFLVMSMTSGFTVAFVKLLEFISR